MTDFQGAEVCQGDAIIIITRKQCISGILPVVRNVSVAEVRRKRLFHLRVRHIRGEILLKNLPCGWVCQWRQLTISCRTNKLVNDNIENISHYDSPSSTSIRTRFGACSPSSNAARLDILSKTRQSLHHIVTNSTAHIVCVII